MVSWVDEWEEVNVNPAKATQEVNRVTLSSSCQLQPLELVRKETEIENKLERPPTSRNSKQKCEEGATPQAQITKAPLRAESQLRSLNKIFKSQSLFKFVNGLVKKGYYMMSSFISSESQHA